MLSNPKKKGKKERNKERNEKNAVLELEEKPNKNEIIAHSVPLIVKMFSHQEKKKVEKKE